MLIKSKKNKKGFSLVELLIVLAIVGLVTPLLFVVFVSGIEDYSSTTKYIDQQYTAMEVARLIRQDFEEAKEIEFTKSPILGVTGVTFKFPTETPPKPAKEWKFETVDGEGGLYLNGTLVISKLDGDNSKFSVDDITKPSRLILEIKPKELNKKYKGRNVNEKIITEFSVRDKVVNVKS